MYRAPLSCRLLNKRDDQLYLLYRIRRPCQTPGIWWLRSAS